MSSQERNLGPEVSGKGAGSRMVRWMEPALWRGLGLRGIMVRVDEEEKESGEPGEGGRRRPGTVFAGAREERKVRWHSRRRVGIEDAGRIAGRENA